MKNPAAVALGKLGGKAGTGKAKARTTAQARKAALARWAKRGKRKQKTMITFNEADKVLKRIKRQIANRRRDTAEIRRELLGLQDTQVTGRPLVEGTCPFAVKARRLLDETY